MYAPSVVEDPLLCTALWLLLLLLLIDLWGLGLDFACTGEGAVNYIVQTADSSKPSFINSVRDIEQRPFPIFS